MRDGETENGHLDEVGIPVGYRLPGTALPCGMTVNRHPFALGGVLW